MEVSLKEEHSISSSPDFAQAYTFIQTFGSLLKLPLITLSNFEEFFVKDTSANDSQMILVHWRLLNTTHRMPQGDWQRSAVKCARRLGLCNENVPYFSLSAQVRLKLFRMCCEEQFDYNVSFKSQLTREMMEGPFSKPLLGFDSSGRRLWLLKDSSFNIRLYGESQYDVVPPKQAKWVELSRTLEGLAEYTAKLESTRGDCLKPESGDSHVTVGKKRARSKSQVASKKKSKANSPVWDGDPSIEGCIKCRKDSNHSQMLLCDECDRECHTYCQYPRLWRVPRGKWCCPICKEGHLIQELKKVYSEMNISKSHYEKVLERKEKSIARLQRTGLLVQNIILEEGEEDVSRRSRRSRKEINYAELNDVQLPSLGPRDLVGSDWNSSPVAKRKRTRQEYVYDDYLAPRIRNSTRRFRGSPNQESEANNDKGTTSDKEEAVYVEEDDVLSSTSERLCGSVTSQSAIESGDPSPHQSNGGDKGTTSDKEEAVYVEDDVLSSASERLCGSVTSRSTIESGLSSPHQSNGGYTISHEPLSNASYKNSFDTCSTTSNHSDVESDLAIIPLSSPVLDGDNTANEHYCIDRDRNTGTM